MLSKKDKRIEAKKNKIKAFLDIIKLNDRDRMQANQVKASNKSESEADNGVSTPQPATASEPGDKPKMSAEELAKLRAELRAKQKANMKKPKVYITLPEWDDDEIKEKLVLRQEEKALFVLDLQHVLLNAAQNQLASWKPRWCKLLRPSMFKGCVVIIVDDLSVEEYLAHPSAMPCLSSRFKMKVEMMSPSQYGRMVTQELFDVPVSFRKINRGQYKSSSKQKESVRIPVLLNEKNDAFSRADLLLNPQQMIEEKCPLPLMGSKYSDYRFSKDSYSQVTATSPLFALDCEMCRTSVNPLELTRVSLVNEKLEVLYDQLIKPPNPITDYLTQYSGITKGMLQGVTATLQDAQRAIADLLPTDAILCGQSLSNDLEALKMFHPYVIDTSVIYNLKGRRQDKTSLKRLAYEFLHREIQTGNKGHSPVEDAIATMELVLLKLQNGPGFGDVIKSGFMYNAQATCDNEPSSTTNIDTASSDEASTKTEGKSNTGQGKTELDNWEPHRNSCSLKRKAASSSSSEDESDHRSKRQKIDQDLIPLDQRKKMFFIQPGSREYECFFEQCNARKKTSVIIGREDQLASFQSRSVSSVTVSSDKHAMRAAKEQCAKHFLTVVHVNKFAQQFTELMSPQEKETVLNKIDGRIEKLLKSVEEKCLVSVLFTGRTTPVSTHHAMNSMMVT